MRDTIKDHKDFLMSPDDPTARSEYFFVRAKAARFADNPRVGFTVTKRTFKLAVDRNRAKRLLRDWVRHYSKILSDKFDYVFIARPGILTATRPMGRTAMKKAFAYILCKYAPRPKKPKPIKKKDKKRKNDNRS